MNKYVVIAISLSLASLPGCARHSKIIIDPHGSNMNHYQTDLAQCEQISEQVDSKIGKGIVGGAAVGAVAGEIVGGGKRTAVGAKLGALSGAVKGGRATRLERDKVIKNCLRNRGYKVLN